MKEKEGRVKNHRSPALLLTSYVLFLLARGGGVFYILQAHLCGLSLMSSIQGLSIMFIL